MLLGRTVERERESVRGQDERQRCAERVARMITDVQADDERALHRPLEMDAEKQPPGRMTTAGGQQRPRPSSVEDSLPEVAAVVDRADPTATGLALERLGFQLHWVLITDNPDPDSDRPTLARSVTAPPTGTEILAILNEQGGNEVTADTRDLMIEIAPLGSEILESHR